MCKAKFYIYRKLKNKTKPESLCGVTSGLIHSSPFSKLPSRSITVSFHCPSLTPVCCNFWIAHYPIKLTLICRTKNLSRSCSESSYFREMPIKLYRHVKTWHKDVPRVYINEERMQNCQIPDDSKGQDLLMY